MSHHDRPVLVVEDDAGLRAYMRSVVEAHGFEVVDAASGEEALEKLDGREAQLAVLDVGLPGMDGFAVADQLDGVPVIIVTGDPVNAYAQAASRALDYQVLPKTMMPELFDSAVGAYSPYPGVSPDSSGSSPLPPGR